MSFLFLRFAFIYLFILFYFFFIDSTAKTGPNVQLLQQTEFVENNIKYTCRQQSNENHFWSKI